MLNLDELYPEEAEDEAEEENDTQDATENEEVDDSPAAMVAITDGPVNYRQACLSEDWSNAMKEEFESLIKNQTWSLVPMPPGRKAITTKWVYTIKYNGDGTVARHKARFVARGFSQIENIDYQEIFAPVAKMESIRMVLALAAKYTWEMVQFDIRTAFLNGPLNEEIYVEQAPGFEKAGPNGQRLVCRLNKALYGLKQAPKSWNDCFTKFLKDHMLEPLETDPCVLVKRINGKFEMLLISYVDDGLICAKDETQITGLIEQMKLKFETKISAPSVLLALRWKELPRTKSSCTR